jgi:hypothetical protein
MKRLLLALALLLAPSLAFAQCTGVFPPNTLCGNTSASPKVPGAVSASTNITGPGVSVVGDLALWNNLTGSSLKDQAPGAFTANNDTNVTATLGGANATALVNAMSLTLGWQGTLAAARLNSNVVQSIVNDTNVTGVIAAQALTLGWTGTLAAGRLNANVVQAFTNDTNVQASISAQNATLAWAGQLAVSRGGTGASTQGGAAIAVLPTPVAPGDILYWNGSAWVTLLGNGTGTQLLSENSSGVPAWVTVTGTGTVTSITQGTGLTFTTTPCTSSCTIGLTVPVIVANGGTGNTTAAAHSLPINEGTFAQANTGTGTIGQALVSNGSIADPTFQNGTWVLLATLTAANSTTLSDTTHITSAFNEYMLVFENLLPATNNTNCELQIHSNGSFPATTYLASSLSFIATTVASRLSTTFIPCDVNDSTWSNSGSGVSGTFMFYNPSQATSHKMIHGEGCEDGSSTICFFNGGFWNGGTTAVDGFQILSSSGNLTSGVVKLYGRL